MLYPDYYYCPDCNKFWDIVTVEIDEQAVEKNFNADRIDEMRQYAMRNIALEKLRRLPYEKLREIVAALEDSRGKEAHG